MGMHVLGLPLDEALQRLASQGVYPTVAISRAPRRPEEVGALRVVQVLDGGQRLVACAFVQDLKEADDA